MTFQADMLKEIAPPHQSKADPADAKFSVGNGEDGKHYWLTPVLEK